MQMTGFLRFGLWSLVALGVVSIGFVAAYAARNGSGHTSWEPFTLLILFVPLAVVGSACFTMRHRLIGVARVSICALLVGLAGVTLVITLDRTNRLVQYDRWVHRGMP